MKLDNKDLIIVTLFLLPGVGFALSLGDMSDHNLWLLHHDLRVYMMIICFFFSFSSLTYLILKKFKK
jgi:hypothetical protein